MKKKLVSLLCAGMLALALPTLAWAANSPSNTTSASTTSSDGVSFSVGIATDADISNNQGGIYVDEHDTPASNYAKPSSGNDDVLVSTFRVWPWGTLEGYTGTIDVTVTFNVGTQYSGMTARIYVQHEIDDSTESMTRIVSSDGTVTFTMTKLSYVTIAIEEGQTVSDSSATTDTSSTSPQTGVDMTGVCGITAAAVVAAVGVALVLRKKVNE